MNHPKDQVTGPRSEFLQGLIIHVSLLSTESSILGQTSKVLEEWRFDTFVSVYGSFFSSVTDIHEVIIKWSSTEIRELSLA